MSNAYFTPSGVPRFNTTGTSAALRAEFVAIGTAFGKLAPLAGNGLRLIQVNAAGTAQQVVTDFTVEQVKALIDGVGAGLFTRAMNVPLVKELAGVYAGGANDNFILDSDQVVSNYGLAWKRFSDVTAGPVGVLTGYGGLRFYTLAAERMHLGTDGRVHIGGTGDASGIAMSMRNDHAPGAMLTLSNRRQDPAWHMIGGTLFDAYRDVAFPSHVAGVWCEATAPLGNIGDLVFGAMANGSPALPAERLRIQGADGAVYPGSDNGQILGTHARRWSVLYSGTGAINTSDAREKSPVAPLTPAEIAAARDLAREIGTFQFLASIAAKGPARARLHVGMTVQRAIELMRAHGLDPMRYGFICLDQWSAEGNQPAGERYGFRTDQLLLFIARGLEARITALEARA